MPGTARVSLSRAIARDGVPGEHAGTRADIAGKLFGGAVEQFVLGFDRPNIRLAVQMKREWKRQLIDFVAGHAGESGIVYCLSRRKTEEAAALLAASGVRALPNHAGMDAAEREAHQNEFMTESGVVIVVSIAFGMGIDKADVRYVFHADLPGSVEPCGNCDVCLDSAERVDATRDAQKILSAAYRTGERFGAAHLIDIVRGARTEKALLRERLALGAVTIPA